MPCRSLGSLNCVGGRIPRQKIVSRLLSTVRQTQDPVNIVEFQRDALQAEEPLVIRQSRGVRGGQLPALTKWFAPSRQANADLAPYLRQHYAVSLPYELILPADTDQSGHKSSLDQFLEWLSLPGDDVRNDLAHLLQSHISCASRHSASETRFLRFEAPLALLAAGLQFNQAASHGHSLEELYIAQAPLDTLPKELQDDVPAPEIVRQAGRGDIYGSSIWIGLEPTYTPWHRDPNPNLFCQLCSSKVIRLLPPRRGEQLFLQARAMLGQGGSSRIRGEEMMQGAERRVLLDAVWGEGVSDDIREVSVASGDALFIPKGWWHSVKSVGNHGGLNASVNWWFR